MPVGFEGAGGELEVESAVFDQELKQGLGEHVEGDLMCAGEFGVQPVAEVQELSEGRFGILPHQAQRAGEMAAVRHEVPVAGEAAHALHLLKGNPKGIAHVARIS